MSNKRTLGRGLHSLIPETNKQENNQVNRPTNNEVKRVEPAIEKKTVESRVVERPVEAAHERRANDEVVKLPLDKISARSDQPRKNFDDEALDDLAKSIKEYGLLNPIVVSKRNGNYEIIAGERRFRASKKIGAREIDAIVRDFDKREIEVLSLIENIQREDLSAIEEANAYKNLADNYQMTQDQIAKTMGKSRSYIANTMRLLNLYPEEKEAMNRGDITPSQGRTLLSISDDSQRAQALDDFINNKTNIRTVEKSVKRTKIYENKNEDTNKAPTIDDILVEDLEERFMDNLGSKVAINKAGKTFKVTIDCYSIEDIEKLYKRIADEN